MDRRFALAAAVSGFLSVALGAFGAHALRDWLTTLPDGGNRLEWWQKAVDYHQLHSVALLALAVWATRSTRQDAFRRRASIALLLGMGVFSGSLYLMTLTGVRILGAITPIGGVALMVGWAFIGVAALDREAAARGA